MGINYVICAAGKGIRFSSIINTPKPLIKIKGRFLIERAISSLPVLRGDNLIIIYQESDNIERFLKRNLEETYPFTSIQWYPINNKTRGQLETVYLAREKLDHKKSTAIFNCDTYFQFKKLFSFFEDSNIDGLIPCSKESGDAWSFCKCGPDGRVTSIAEKERISNLASIGFYYFRDTERFIKNLHDYILLYNSSKEMYVIPFYEKFIREGKFILAPEVDLFCPMGTPDQIYKYWGITPENLLKEQDDKVLVVDLDNTITVETNSSYKDKIPNTSLIKKLQEYKNMGYQIFIYSARRMLTHNGDEARVTADIGETTINWLKKHKVPFDGLRFGKPFARNGFYIDDKSIRPDEFINLSESEIFNLINSRY